MHREKTLTGEQRWFVDFDRQCWEEVTANIHYPILGFGGTARVSVAQVDCVPVDTDHPDANEDDPLVREGEDSDRLQNVCLIVHAPDMLDCLKRVQRKLSELCEGNVGDTGPEDASKFHRMKLHEMLNTEENHPLWVRLTELLQEVDSCVDEATDLETV